MDPQSFEALSFALDVVLKATLLIGFAGLIRLFLRRASASLRQAIGVLTLGALLALPAIAPMLPDWKVPVIPTLLTGPEAQAEPARGRIERAALSETGRDAARPAPAVADSAPTGGTDRSAALERTADFGYGVVAEPEVQPVAPARAVDPPSPRTLVTLLFLLWGAGASALLLHLALGIRRVRRYARRAEPAGDERWAELSRELSERLGLARPVRFLFTDDVPVAVTAGYFRPILLLPQAARRWSPELRRVVVLHELAHVRRGDWGVLLLGQVAAAIYWFHPLVWLGVRHLRRDSEQAADDLVLRSGTKPSVYAGHLLGIIRSLRHAAPSPLPVMGVARPSQFEARLKAILDPAASRREASPGQVRLAASFAAAAVLTLGALQPWKTAEAALPPSLVGGSSSGKIAGDSDASECDSKRKEKKDAEAEEAAVVASLPEDSDFAQVSAENEDSSSAEESDADSYASGDEDGAAVPAVRSVPPVPDTAASSGKGFVQAGRRSPRDGDDWYDRGMHHHRDGDYDEAIAAFQKSIEQGHKEAAASYNIACGYALKGDADRAFEWLDRAMEAGFDVSEYIGQDDDLESLESDPRFAKYKQKAREARRELKRKQIEHKLARYERITRDEPKNGAAWYKLGYELYELGEHDRAASAFQQAAALHHNEPASLYNAACMLSLKGDRRSALAYLERAILAGFGGADKLREDDDLDNIRSEPRFRELLRLAEELEMPPIEQWGWNKYARSKSKVQEQWRQAADDIEKFARQHPEIGRAWFNLGFSRIQAGQPDQAVPAFQKALELGHRKGTSMYNLACAYSLLDQKEQAFDWLFKAIEAGAGKGMVRRDPDLDNLRGHPRYREALRLAESRHGSDDDD
jgi:Flp pilus assembly protein TadD/beta-lactamase regulating signal transducer with metallopeptidase domain